MRQIISIITALTRAPPTLTWNGRNVAKFPRSNNNPAMILMTDKAEIIIPHHAQMIPAN